MVTGCSSSHSSICLMQVPINARFNEIYFSALETETWIHTPVPTSAKCRTWYWHAMDVVCTYLTWYMYAMGERQRGQLDAVVVVHNEWVTYRSRSPAAAMGLWSNACFWTRAAQCKGLNLRLHTSYVMLISWCRVWMRAPPTHRTRCWLIVNNVGLFRR